MTKQFFKQKAGNDFVTVWAKLAVWGAERGFLDLGKGMGESGAKLIETLKM